MSGEILQSKCGQFQPFKGDDSTAPEVKPTLPCKKCNGLGKIQVQFLSGPQRIKCPHCDGKGRIF
jgi:DnaJ-class molecular chaperone